MSGSGKGYLFVYSSPTWFLFLGGLSRLIHCLGITTYRNAFYLSTTAVCCLKRFILIISFLDEASRGQAEKTAVRKCAQWEEENRYRD